MTGQIPIDIKVARKEIAKALDLLKEAFTDPYIDGALAQGLVIERQRNRIKRALALVNRHLVDRQQDSLWVARHGGGEGTPS